MIIKELSLANFRNIEKVHLEPSCGINLFAGENAQGKSNLLEALVLIATGRSFRTSKDCEMIKWGENTASAGAVVCETDTESSIKLVLNNSLQSKKRISIDGKPIKKLSQFINKVDSVVFSRNDLNQISGPPLLRRNFLDRMICTINSSYLFALQSYCAVIKQKNIALKQYPVKSDLIDVLNLQMAQYGARIILERKFITGKLSANAAELYSSLFGSGDILEIEYISANSMNLTGEKELSEYLMNKFKLCKKIEIERKMALEGPQRDDLLIKINHKPLKVYGSQGQKRFASVVIKLSEGKVYNEIKKRIPIIFMDDCFSEIDSVRRGYLWDYLSSQKQVFLSANDIPEKGSFSVFTIKSGKVESVVHKT